MALAPLEVLIYALVIAGKPVPADCTLKADKTIVCSNGMKAAETPAHDILFNDKILVSHAHDGGLMFSNGITAQMGSAGWIRFSNGVSARRDPRGSGGFVVSPDLFCQTVEPGRAECIRR
jgi:hypothetical protein